MYFMYQYVCLTASIHSWYCIIARQDNFAVVREGATALLGLNENRIPRQIRIG